jgi:hypothetical protein
LGERMDLLETNRSRKNSLIHSRSNSFGSRDEDPRARGINFGAEQETKTRDGETEGQDFLDDAIHNLAAVEDDQGRTSMIRVMKQTESRYRRTSLGKDIQMAEDSVLDQEVKVQPTIKVPPFEYKLKSTAPGAILKFIRGWVRYQTQHRVKVNPYTQKTHH